MSVVDFEVKAQVEKAFDAFHARTRELLDERRPIEQRGDRRVANLCELPNGHRPVLPRYGLPRCGGCGRQWHDELLGVECAPARRAGT